MYKDERFPLFLNINGINDSKIEWKRPKEICENPKNLL